MFVLVVIVLVFVDVVGVVKVLIDLVDVLVPTSFVTMEVVIASLTSTLILSIL